MRGRTWRRHGQRGRSDPPRRACTACSRTRKPADTSSPRRTRPRKPISRRANQRRSPPTSRTTDTCAACCAVSAAAYGCGSWLPCYCCRCWSGESMPAGVELTAPLWLLALPIVAAVLVALRWPWWRAALTPWMKPSPRGRGEARRLAIRLAWCTLVVLALAQATIVRPLVHQATALVLDTSASMTSVRDQLEDAALNAERALPQGDQLSIVASADGARVEESPTDRPVFTRLGTTLGDQASDLAAGLRLGAGVLPTDYARRVVLASDGRQTRGAALGLAREP